MCSFWFVITAFVILWTLVTLLGPRESVFAEEKRAKTGSDYDSLHTTEETNYVDTQSKDRKY